jgi:hypothetical protein
MKPDEERQLASRRQRGLWFIEQVEPVPAEPPGD